MVTDIRTRFILMEIYSNDRLYYLFAYILARGHVKKLNIFLESFFNLDPVVDSPTGTVCL